MRKVRKFCILIILCLSFSIFMLMSLGVTYAIFEYQAHGKIQNFITTKTAEVSD
ncbi:MAG: hypothetical protein PUB18_06480 [bacterium]|nr:hypothetical protein [bacterium]